MRDRHAVQFWSLRDVQDFAGHRDLDYAAVPGARASRQQVARKDARMRLICWPTS
jgi:hypothetical protein